MSSNKRPLTSICFFSNDKISKQLLQCFLLNGVILGVCTCISYLNTVSVEVVEIDLGPEDVDKPYTAIVHNLQ